MRAVEVKLTQRTTAVLAELLTETSRARYGLEIARRCGVGVSTVYDILMKLERSGWVESEWERVDPQQAGRPRRRLYRLTGRGAAQAQADLKAEVERLNRAIRPDTSPEFSPSPSAVTP